MNQMPQKIKDQIDIDPFYRLCIRRSDGCCEGRITMEHAMIYAGKQVQEIWAIIPLCWFHHLGAGMNKEKNQAVALARATDEDFKKYPKSDWVQKKKYLVEKYKLFLKKLRLL